MGHLASNCEGSRSQPRSTSQCCRVAGQSHTTLPVRAFRSLAHQRSRPLARENCPQASGKNEKYLEIAPENYFEIVTDLVGVRALHLFKDECFAIGDAISKTWTVSETPVAYVRQGDPQALTEKFRSNGWTVKEHPAGYRSVHYVVSTKPLQRTIFAEMQVRTIFEEGWSEIDHRVRYLSHPGRSYGRLLNRCGCD